MLRKSITKINNFFLAVFNSIENDTKNWREIVAFCLFCVGTIILSCFHEPWFDEFQAWEISKSSLYDILFVIPHQEGHPPFWALILKLFSFFNVDAEVGLKIPNLLFIISAVWLLIFKSPFPRIFRITLPFSYFIFYQTAIINRPYSIFCFAIFLIASLFETRNEKPFRFVSSLFLLCLSSAYGMLFAAGITLAWLIEIYNKQKFFHFLKKFFKDSRFYAMLFLLVGACSLAVIICPEKDVSTLPFLKGISFWERVIAVFFVIPSDALVTDYLFNYTRVYWGLFLWQKIYYFWVVLLGVCFNTLFIVTFQKVKKIAYFLIPYLLFLLFCFVYVFIHHLGLLVFFLIFIFWISFADIKEKLSSKFLCFLGYLFALVLIIQLNWASSSSIAEIRYDYDIGRSVSKYIKENNLLQYNILAGWQEDVVSIGEEQKIRTKTQLEFLGVPVCVNPYFNKNIFYNFNIDKPNVRYSILRKRSDLATERTKQQWAKIPLPEVIIKNNNDFITFDGTNYIVDENYVLAKAFYNANVWKNIIYSEEFFLYLRRDIAEKLGIKSIQ